MLQGDDHIGRLQLATRGSNLAGREAFWTKADGGLERTTEAFWRGCLCCAVDEDSRQRMIGTPSTERRIHGGRFIQG